MKQLKKKQVVAVAKVLQGTNAARSLPLPTDKKANEFEYINHQPKASTYHEVGKEQVGNLKLAVSVSDQTFRCCAGNFLPLNSLCG